jgi:hypothetical protein
VLGKKLLFGCGQHWFNSEELFDLWRYLKDSNFFSRGDWRSGDGHRKGKKDRGAENSIHHKLSRCIAPVCPNWYAHRVGAKLDQHYKTEVLPQA